MRKKSQKKSHTRTQSKEKKFCLLFLPASVKYTQIYAPHQHKCTRANTHTITKTTIFYSVVVAMLTAIFFYSLNAMYILAYLFVFDERRYDARFLLGFFVVVFFLSTSLLLLWIVFFLWSSITLLYFSNNKMKKKKNYKQSTEFNGTQIIFFNKTEKNNPNLLSTSLTSRIFPSPPSSL